MRPKSTGNRNGQTLLLIVAASILLSASCRQPTADLPVSLRVATFNVEDVRTDDLLHPDHPRLIRLVSVLQELRPHVVLINEIAYDQEGVPGFDASVGPGKNGERLAETYLAVSRDPDQAPLHYQAVMMPSNTGLASGFDLDNDGLAVSTRPDVPSATEDGAPGRQTQEGRSYGNDSWGFGMFPGQYAMALLVADSLTVLTDQIRTFQRFKWSDMPGAQRPIDPLTQIPWYDDDEWLQMRLSSKTHMDVPVLLPNGAVVHFLCSHPTPPAFDGAEIRNQLRNHDEIRFWADYLKGESYITDDDGKRGGFTGRSFVLLGDLNADPDEGSSYENPIGNLLLKAPGVNSQFVPQASRSITELDEDDTASWGLRIDYVLPSADLTVVDGAVNRYDPAKGVVSDHFPVWLDLTVPPHVER